MSECPICYEEITSETGSVNLSCSHQFHLTCITSWFSKQGSCPCCRKVMGEKEALVRYESDDESDADDDEDEDDEDAEEEDPSDPRNKNILSSTIDFTFSELNAILTSMKGAENLSTELSPFRWKNMVESRFYSITEVNNEVALVLCFDELHSIIIERCWKNLTRGDWNKLIKKHLPTVSFNHTEFQSYLNEISLQIDLNENEWESMVESDMHAFDEPRYKGETRMCFTYKQLSNYTINICYRDLTWKKWKEVLKRQKEPLTASFMSAAKDFSEPLRLPNVPASRVWYYVDTAGEVTEGHNRNIILN